MRNLDCATSTNGAKLYDATYVDMQMSSVEFINPTAGGSAADVAGLLSSNCTAATGRAITSAKISGETSQVYANYNVSTTLPAGAYSDTLTISMNVP